MKIVLLNIITGFFLLSCNSLGNKLVYYNSNFKLGDVNKVIFFEPSIFPEIEEIKHPTHQAFFSGASDQISLYHNVKIVQMDHALDYKNIDTQYIMEIGKNNEAEAIVVPHIEYFKVGFGKYVFSNQVLINFKLYDQKGNFLMETQYDTYKGNARLIGKAENTIKIGTKTAIKDLIKHLKKRKML